MSRYWCQGFAWAGLSSRSTSTREARSRFRGFRLLVPILGTSCAFSAKSRAFRGRRHAAGFVMPSTCSTRNIVARLVVGVPDSSLRMVWTWTPTGSVFSPTAVARHPEDDGFHKGHAHEYRAPPSPSICRTGLQTLVGPVEMRKRAFGPSAPNSMRSSCARISSSTSF